MPQCCCIVCVSEAEVGILETCSKFERTVVPGLSFAIPCIQNLTTAVSLRVQQMEVATSTKTLDNVTVTVKVAVQYKVVSSKVEDAFYRLTYPEAQIRSYVDDVVRSALPKMKLDEAYEAKAQVASDVKKNLASQLAEFGYEIIAALVTDLEPDSKVKASMNEINAAQRLREAAQEKAEADKILAVKAAEAEAEAKYLSGTGVARQRQAIVDGLRESINDFASAIPGTTAADVMNMMMTVQYLDMLKDVGNNNANQTVFLPSDNGSKSAEIRQGILEANSKVPMVMRRQ